MEVEIKPTENIQALKKNLKPRVENIKEENGLLIVETSSTDFLEKIPGIKEYTVKGETHKALGGSPVDEEAYIKIHSKEDVAKAFLATASGYNLVVIDSSREWDLKLLRKYNPSIKEVSEPSDVFGIEKSVNVEGFEKVDIDIDEDEVDAIYHQVFK